MIDHVSVGVRSLAEAERFYAAALGALGYAALANGGTDDGAPGPRAHDDPARTYYAAFVRDPDGNRIEAVCFVEGDQRCVRR